MATYFANTYNAKADELRMKKLPFVEKNVKGVLGVAITELELDIATRTEALESLRQNAIQEGGRYPMDQVVAHTRVINAKREELAIYKNELEVLFTESK